mgnify:CR=1 FL=1
MSSKHVPSCPPTTVITRTLLPADEPSSMLAQLDDGSARPLHHCDERSTVLAVAFPPYVDVVRVTATSREHESPSAGTYVNLLARLLFSAADVTLLGHGSVVPLVVGGSLRHRGPARLLIVVDADGRCAVFVPPPPTALGLRVDPPSSAQPNFPLSPLDERLLCVEDGSSGRPVETSSCDDAEGGSRRKGRRVLRSLPMLASFPLHVPSFASRVSRSRASVEVKPVATPTRGRQRPLFASLEMLLESGAGGVGVTPPASTPTLETDKCASVVCFAAVTDDPQRVDIVVMTVGSASRGGGLPPDAVVTLRCVERPTVYHVKLSGTTAVTSLSLQGVQSPTRSNGVNGGTVISLMVLVGTYQHQATVQVASLLVTLNLDGTYAVTPDEERWINVRHRLAATIASSSVPSELTQAVQHGGGVNVVVTVDPASQRAMRVHALTAVDLVHLRGGAKVVRAVALPPNGLGVHHQPLSVAASIWSPANGGGLLGGLRAGGEDVLSVQIVHRPGSVASALLVQTAPVASSPPPSRHIELACRITPQSFRGLFPVWGSDGLFVIVTDEGAQVVNISGGGPFLGWAWRTAGRIVAMGSDRLLDHAPGIVTVSSHGWVRTVTRVRQLAQLAYWEPPCDHPQGSTATTTTLVSFDVRCGARSEGTERTERTAGVQALRTYLLLVATAPIAAMGSRLPPEEDSSPGIMTSGSTRCFVHDGMDAGLVECSPQDCPFALPQDAVMDVVVFDDGVDEYPPRVATLSRSGCLCVTSNFDGTHDACDGDGAVPLRSRDSSQKGSSILPISHGSLTRQGDDVVAFGVWEESSGSVLAAVRRCTIRRADAHAPMVLRGSITLPQCDGVQSVAAVAAPPPTGQKAETSSSFVLIAIATWHPPEVVVVAASVENAASPDLSTMTLALLQRFRSDAGVSRGVAAAPPPSLWLSPGAPNADSLAAANDTSPLINGDSIGDAFEPIPIQCRALSSPQPLTHPGRRAPQGVHRDVAASTGFLVLWNNGSTSIIVPTTKSTRVRSLPLYGSTRHRMIVPTTASAEGDILLVGGPSGVAQRLSSRDVLAFAETFDESVAGHVSPAPLPPREPLQLPSPNAPARNNIRSSFVTAAGGSASFIAFLTNDAGVMLVEHPDATRNEEKGRGGPVARATFEFREAAGVFPHRILGSLAHLCDQLGEEQQVLTTRLLVPAVPRFRGRLDLPQRAASAAMCGVDSSVMFAAFDVAASSSSSSSSSSAQAPPLPRLLVVVASHANGGADGATTTTYMAAIAEVGALVADAFAAAADTVSHALQWVNLPDGSLPVGATFIQGRSGVAIALVAANSAPRAMKPSTEVAASPRGVWIADTRPFFGDGRVHALPSDCLAVTSLSRPSSEQPPTVVTCDGMNVSVYACASLKALLPLAHVALPGCCSLALCGLGQTDPSSSWVPGNAPPASCDGTTLVVVGSMLSGPSLLAFGSSARARGLSDPGGTPPTGMSREGTNDAATMGGGPAGSSSWMGQASGSASRTSAHDWELAIVATWPHSVAGFPLVLPALEPRACAATVNRPRVPTASGYPAPHRLVAPEQSLVTGRTEGRTDVPQESPDEDDAAADPSDANAIRRVTFADASDGSGANTLASSSSAQKGRGGGRSVVSSLGRPSARRLLFAFGRYANFAVLGGDVLLGGRALKASSSSTAAATGPGSRTPPTPVLLPVASSMVLSSSPSSSPSPAWFCKAEPMSICARGDLPGRPVATATLEHEGGAAASNLLVTQSGQLIALGLDNRLEVAALLKRFESALHFAQHAVSSPTGGTPPRGSGGSSTTGPFVVFPSPSNSFERCDDIKQLFSTTLDTERAQPFPTRNLFAGDGESESVVNGDVVAAASDLWLEACHQGTPASSPPTPSNSSIQEATFPDVVAAFIGHVSLEYPQFACATLPSVSRPMTLAVDYVNATRSLRGPVWSSQTPSSPAVALSGTVTVSESDIAQGTRDLSDLVRFVEEVGFPFGAAHRTTSS